MTLDDLDRAKKLAETYRLLLKKADALEAERPAAGMLLGYTFDATVCGVLCGSLVSEYRRLAGVAEAALRELGILFPGDPAPGVARQGYTSTDDAAAENATVVRGTPDPRLHEIGHPVIHGSSWDPDAGTFTVRFPCWPATSRRWIDGAWVQVDEALNPRGLEGGTFGTPVIDQTEGEEAIVGTVDWCVIHEDSIEITVRLNPTERRVREAIEQRRLYVVGVGYEILYEEVTPRGGARMLADVIRWRLAEIRLHRLDALTKAA